MCASVHYLFRDEQLGGTVFFVDPAEDLFAVLLTQAPGLLNHWIELYPALVYAAL